MSTLPSTERPINAPTQIYLYQSAAVRSGSLSSFLSNSLIHSLLQNPPSAPHLTSLPAPCPAVSALSHTTDKYTHTYTQLDNIFNIVSNKKEKILSEKTKKITSKLISRRSAHISYSCQRAALWSWFNTVSVHADWGGRLRQSHCDS